MTPNEYQKLAWETAKPFYKHQSNDGTFKTLQVVTLTLALSGEAGELANKLKKMVEAGRYLNDLPSREILIEELGDVQWYVASVAEILGCPLEYLMGQNVSKLRERYPQTLTNKKTL